MSTLAHLGLGVLARAGHVFASSWKTAFEVVWVHKLLYC